MPAFPTEIEEALEEEIKIQDCWEPKRIRQNGKGELTIEFSRCLRVFDEKGLFAPQLENACGLSPSADSVVVAIGQRRDLSALPAKLHPSNGHGLADAVTLQTQQPKIFAAGDLLTGPRSVIEAMAQGREAALSIDRFLSGETLRWGRVFWEGATISDFAVDRTGALARSRAVLPRLPIAARDLQGEVEKTMDPKTARDEAERCLNCGRPAEVNQTCWYCLPCEIECPVDALEVRLPYFVR